MFVFKDMAAKGTWNNQMKPSWWPFPHFKSPNCGDGWLDVEQMDVVLNACRNFLQKKKLSKQTDQRNPSFVIMESRVDDIVDEDATNETRDINMEDVAHAANNSLLEEIKDKIKVCVMHSSFIFPFMFRRRSKSITLVLWSILFYFLC